MADRLVELYAEVAAKAARLDASLAGLEAHAPELGDRGLEEIRRVIAGVQREWSQLRALIGEQAGLLDDIAARTRELSSLAAFLQTHYEREKQRLARELHDQLGGILTPARMDLAWLQARLGGDPAYGERLARLSSMIDQGIDLKRRIIENLRPSLLDHLGLAAAVQWYADEACGAARLAHRVTASKFERLPPDLEIALYRVVQESVNNAIQHAQARNVEIVVERTGAGLRVAVCDDGVGIADLEDARARSHGLSAMAQRMRSINGTLSIHSGEGAGTRVEAFLPIAA
jgi:signal transduction histidine kinase